MCDVLGVETREVSRSTRLGMEAAVAMFAGERVCFIGGALVRPQETA